LARSSSGEWGSPAAAQRRPRELVLRRAGGSAKETCARVGSRCVGKSSRRAQMATGTSGARCSSAAAMVALAGLGVSRENGQRGGFYSRAQVVRRCAMDRLTPRHGMGRGMAQTESRRTAAPWPMASSGRRARPVGERHVDCLGNPLTPCTEANARSARTPGRGPASACVYGEVRWHPTWRRQRSAGDVARGGAQVVFHFSLEPVDQDLLKFLQLKCAKKCIPKLYTSHPSTTSRKALYGFSQPNFHKLHAKLVVFWAPVNSNPGR
jgi:hypothetical protein